ncbi:acyl-CoA dehydrogenase family protein [Nocardioides insulae]|uniref:acyl-CoA dehydrogenase family protein n=1 Tax=Nocardioides insulae TaxID=394734 RepID=UPI00041C45C7|nr:acyl-CoA dehydrogenase family protein [Nocardioides insulae]
MDFSFTYEQSMLRESVTRYLEKNYAFETRQEIVRSAQPYSSDAWKTYHELGLLALPFPEEAGGLDGSIVDLIAIAEPFGAHLVVEPYVPSIMLAGGALAAVREQPLAQQWLEKIIEGEAIGAFAHEDSHRVGDAKQGPVRATASGDGHRLEGRKQLVLAAAEADVLVVSATAENGAQALFALEPTTPGVSLTPFTTIDGRSAAHVDFDGVEVPAQACLSADAAEIIGSVVGQALVVLAAEAVGATGEVLRQTAEYAGTRHQFGVPIGSFQTVAHRLADMKMDATKAQATLLYTAALVEAGTATPRDISVLKAQVGRLGRKVAEAAVQTHGGIGMTDELAIGHYLKRIVLIETIFGDSDYHYRLVGAAN